MSEGGGFEIRARVVGKGEGVDALCGNWEGIRERIFRRERIGRTSERAKIGDGFRVVGGGLVGERGCRTGRAAAESDCMRVDGGEFAPCGKGERGMRLIRSGCFGRQPTGIW